MRLPQVYIEPHARWISTPPRTASTPTATEDSEACAVRVAAGWMEPRRADWVRAPKAHLGLGGDKIVPRARHERRLELARESGLDAAAHRAAWGLCGLEALGVRDEREEEEESVPRHPIDRSRASHQDGAKRGAVCGSWPAFRFELC